MRELTLMAWQGLPESLRLELLETVQFGSNHRDDVPESLYALAAEMLENSWNAVVQEEFESLTTENAWAIQ